MALIQIKTDPSTTELRWFALVWLVFFGMLASLCLLTERMVQTLALTTSVMFLVALVGNRELALKLRLAGLVVPVVLWLLVAGDLALGARGATALPLWPPLPAHPKWQLALGVLAFGALGAIFIFASLSSARALYRGWMHAVLPIGWTFSLLLLAVVYFAVLTPIGWLRRTFGGDPLARRLEPERDSYWTDHPGPAEPDRYFRQF
jgi:hypothetical protein